MEKGISTALIEQHASVLTKSMMRRLLDLEMRCKASDAKIEELEQCWNKTKNILQQIRPEYSKPWRNIDSDEVVLSPEKGVFQLSRDLYSVIATASLKSRAFWFSLLIIFGFQFTLLFLLAFHQMDIFNTKTLRSVDNPLNLPPNVEATVRLAQVLILVVALFSQGDLLGGVENLSLGMPAHYRGAPRFRRMNHMQWRFASIVRVSQGVVYILCAFILSVQSETVFDVLLNVLGVGFVSDLDDLVFRLGTLGYFGGPMKRLTSDIEQCDFVRTEVADKGRITGWFKKSLHRIVTYSCLGVVLYLFYVISTDQIKGRYTVKNIFVELSDASIPRSTSFSGQYVAEQNDLFHRRLVYRQIDASIDASISERGQFMYCEEREGASGGAWVFAVDQNDIVDPCKDFTLTSDRTVTYDILSIENWYFSVCEEQSVDTLTIHESFACQRPVAESNKSVGTFHDLCPVIQGAGSLPLYQMSIDKDSTQPDYNTTLGHGVYLSRESTAVDGRELLFFSGSTWVMTTEQQLGFNGSEISDMLDSGLDLGLDWVNLITQPVSSDDIGYWPYREQFYAPSQNESSAPFADTSMLVGSFECMRCESLNSSVSCNTGNCNVETGLCDCLHNETGAFCENPPLGNGICDDPFNQASTDFDGGDCCASTCTRPNCGEGGLKTLFGWDTESLYYTEISTEEMIGFQKCKDEQMTAVSLELVPLSNVTELCAPAFTVHCGTNSVLYLKTPLFCATDLSRLEQERIMVPSGSTCNLTTYNSNLTNGIERIQLLQEGGGDSNSSEILVEVPVFDEVLEWSVP